MAALVGACLEAGVDGLTVANSQACDGLSRLSTGSGGLSGRSIFPTTVTMVRDVRAQAGSGIAINACGGISYRGRTLGRPCSPAPTRFKSTRDSLYEGPGLVKRINNELLRIIDEHARATSSAQAPVRRMSTECGYPAGDCRSTHERPQPPSLSSACGPARRGSTGRHTSR